jgi:hypothetical protein
MVGEGVAVSVGNGVFVMVGRAVLPAVGVAGTANVSALGEQAASSKINNRRCFFIGSDFLNLM